MADYVVKGESLTAVADAIREKTGETDALGLGEMPEKVGEVYDTGLHAMDGEAQSQTELINQIADVLQNKAGTFYDTLWDAVQQNGARTSYDYGFAGNSWMDETFKPKYDIRPTSALNMFTRTGSLDLVACCDDRGVTLSFEDCTNIDGLFFWGSVTRVGELDTRKVMNLGQPFYGASDLHTIQKLILKEDGTQSFGTNPFYLCNALENITVEGKIGYGFKFSYSPKLTHDSLMSIINALKDYSGSGTTYTVTLGATNLAKLTDAEKAIATGKGWTLA